MMRAITGVFVVLTSALCSAAAYAEPIPVTRVLAFTDGRVGLNPSDVLVVRFEGSGLGFSLDVFAEAGGAPVRLKEPTMNPSFVVQSSAFGPLSAVLRLDGQTVPLHGGSHALSLQVTGPTAPVVRRTDPIGQISIEVVFPFELTGWLVGTSSDGTEYRLNLLGQGRGSHSWLDDGGPIYVGSFLTFESEAPVPEPGTMLLVSTGLALAALRRRSLARARE